MLKMVKFEPVLTTYRNMSPQGGQTRATCCPQQCCNNIATCQHVLACCIVWPGLNDTPTVSRQLFLGAVRSWYLPSRPYKSTNQFQRNRIMKPSTDKHFSPDSEDDRRSECRNVSVEKCKGISFHVSEQLKTCKIQFEYNGENGHIFTFFSFNQITSKIRARYNFRKQARLI